MGIMSGIDGFEEYLRTSGLPTTTTNTSSSSSYKGRKRPGCTYTPLEARATEGTYEEKLANFTSKRRKLEDGKESEGGGNEDE